MNEIAIIKAIMKDHGASGAFLAEKLGYKTASGVTNRLQSKTMSVETLIKMLDALDCELVIKEKAHEKRTYVVTNEDRGEVKSYRKGEVSENE